MIENADFISAVTEKARFLFEAQVSARFTDDPIDVYAKNTFDAGVACGMTATVLALREQGHLPPDFGGSVFDDPAGDR